MLRKTNLIQHTNHFLLPLFDSQTLLCKNIFQSEYGVFQCTRGSNRLNQRLNVEMYFIECVLELVNGRANQLAVKHASLHMI